MATNFNRVFLNKVISHGKRAVPASALLLSVLFSLEPLPALAVTPVSGKQEVFNLSLEELANLDITSVSKQSGRLSDAPASVFVITSRDIRRSGVNSLPEALRLAPNLQVARIDANRYAITARGYNGTVANKLLVLIDGRSVYTPLYSGVFWDAQDILLEDIERIEVISGPGGTIWGTNAVNGVINVVTHKAADTQGRLFSAGGGTSEKDVALRYGGQLGSNRNYRVYGKFSDHASTELRNGNDASDAWDRAQAGFRFDLSETGQHLTVQGDVYEGELEQIQPGTREIAGVNLLTRWESSLASGSNFHVQAYYDHTERDHPGVFGEDVDTLDFEFQYNMKPISGHALSLGGGYRYVQDRVQNSAVLAFLPSDRDLHWKSLYVQDEIALGEAVRVTIGVRMENNDYTGTEFLPGARISWNVSDNQVLWGAVSRAVRTPSRLDRELFTPGQAPFVIAGGPSFDSEISQVYEIGFRGIHSSNLTYSVTAFHHVFDKLRSLEPTLSGQLVFDNLLEGETTGIEAWSSFQATDYWRLSGGFLTLDQNVRLKSGGADTSGGTSVGNDPTFQWMLRSSADLFRVFSFDVMLRRVGALPEPSVPAYTALDMRLGWSPDRDIDLSLVVKNVLDHRHPEFGAMSTRSEIDRSLYLKLLWSF